MFDLVADVENYPKFVPLCERLIIRARQEQADGTEIMIADMTVAYGPRRESFVTRVVLNRAANVIEASYVDGPFSHLNNVWRFEGTASGSDVHFFIDYAFKSRTLGLLMGAVFDKAFKKFAEAFENRADAIYA